MQQSGNACPVPRSDGDVVRQDPRGASECTCRRSTCCKVRLKKPASESMGRTEANEKHRPTALKRAGGGAQLAQLFQFQNERAAVRKPDRPSHQTENGMTSLKNSTTSPTVQSATPPTSVHNALRCDRIPRAVARPPAAPSPASSLRLFTGQSDDPHAGHNRKHVDASVFAEPSLGALNAPPLPGSAGFLGIHHCCRPTVSLSTRLMPGGFHAPVNASDFGA